MDQFCTMFTLADNEHLHRRHTVRTKDAIAVVAEDPNESVRHFMEAYAKGSWFAVLLNKTRARIETERPSSASHVR